MAKTTSWIAAALLALLPGVGCGGDSDGTGARQVDTVIESLTAAYEDHDPYAEARFYSAGGTLDLTEWGGGVATTPAQIVDAVQDLHLVAEFAHLRAEHVFVSPDGAAVWWSAWGDADGGSWMQSYVFGPGGRTASRVFDSLDVAYVAPRT